MTSTIVASEPIQQEHREEKLPPLINGDHLTRAEFERRYAALPSVKKAELIEGVVYMASPVHLDTHSKPHSRIILFLGSYVAATPGTDFGDNATVHLDRENEVQPDAFLRLREELGGQSRKSDNDYLEGTPELIVEVAASSAAYDLYEKLRVYRRNGVQEYLVLLAYEQEIRWFQLVEGAYRQMQADEHGILRSQVFPGLDLHPESLWTDQLPELLKVLQDGLASAAHQAFVAELQARQTQA